MRIMIAGGGTGGHLFPALAVAEAFMDRDRGNQVLFVGSGRGLESSIVAREGYDLKTVEVASLKGKNIWGQLAGLMTIPRSIGQSGKWIHAFRPDLALGFGGYASGPVVLTAWAMGTRTAIHEQNAFPGLSNRILGRFVDRVFISFESSGPYFPRAKTVLTGNPVRKEFRQRSGVPPPQTGEKFTLFIFGGSQGAHHLNQAMEEALGLLGDLKKRLRVIHQTGERDYDRVREAYGREGIEAEVHRFIRDMDQVYGAAHLVLCRAGATTLFELMAMGKPAVLVPYPYAANDHQRLNAQTLVEAGGALMVADGDLNGTTLSQVLRQLSGDPKRLEEMGERTRALAKTDAAERIAGLCYRMVNDE